MSTLGNLILITTLIAAPCLSCNCQDSDGEAFVHKFHDAVNSCFSNNSQDNDASIQSCLSDLIDAYMIQDVEWEDGLGQRFHGRDTLKNFLNNIASSFAIQTSVSEIIGNIYQSPKYTCTKESFVYIQYRAVHSVFLVDENNIKCAVDVSSTIFLVLKTNVNGLQIIKLSEIWSEPYGEVLRRLQDCTMHTRRQIWALSETFKKFPYSPAHALDSFNDATLVFHDTTINGTDNIIEFANLFNKQIYASYAILDMKIGYNVITIERFVTIWRQNEVHIRNTHPISKYYDSVWIYLNFGSTLEIYVLPHQSEVKGMDHPSNEHWWYIN